MLYFVDLFHYFPHIVKKDSNISPGLKDILKSWETSISKVTPIKRETTNRNEGELLRLLIERAGLRFCRRTSLFRFFDSNSVDISVMLEWTDFSCLIQSRIKWARD